MFWYLVRDYGQRAGIKTILSELIPYFQNGEIELVIKLASKKAKTDNKYTELTNWLIGQASLRKTQAQ
jgi:hypothetical protein